MWFTFRTWACEAYAHCVSERIYDENHIFPEAIAEGERAVALSGDDGWIALDLATTYALAGKKTEMQNDLRKVSALVGLYDRFRDFRRPRSRLTVSRIHYRDGHHLYDFLHFGAAGEQMYRPSHPHEDRTKRRGLSDRHE